MKSKLVDKIVNKFEFKKDAWNSECCDYYNDATSISVYSSVIFIYRWFDQYGICITIDPLGIKVSYVKSGILLEVNVKPKFIKDIVTPHLLKREIQKMIDL